MTVASSTAAAHSRVKHGTSYADILSGVFNHRAGANPDKAPFASAGTIVAREGGVPKYFDQGADADSGLDAMVSTVKTIFSKVLNVDIALIGLSSDFFELGGSSLDTIALICRIEQDVNIQGKRVVFIQVSRSSCHQNLTSLMPQLLYAFKFRKMSSFLTRP